MDQSKKEQKDISRQAILGRAAERLRRDGIAALGVRPLMADAGLTHGGFYAHFPSRSDLVAAALEHAADSTIGFFRAAAAAAPEGARLEAIIDTYLQPRHCEEMARGCTASALAPDIARADTAARTRFVRRNRAFIDLIADHLPAGGKPEERLDRAHVIFASMMGMLQLMRIEEDVAEVERMRAAGRAAALMLAHCSWATEAAISPGPRRPTDR